MSTAEPVRHRYGRLFVRLGLVLAAVAAVTFGLVALDGVGRDVRQVGVAAQDQIVPIAEILENQASAHVELERLLQNPDVAARFPGLQRLLELRERTAAIWADLKPRLTTLPGAVPGIAAYDASVRATELNSDFLQEVVLTSDPRALITDPRFVGLQMAEDAQRGAVGELLAVSVAESVVAPAAEANDRLGSLGRLGVAWALLAAGLAVAIVAYAAQSIRRDVRAHRRELADVAAHARRLKFDQDVATGLSMARTETASLAIAEEALAEVGLLRTAELLLADSSQAHLEPVVVVGPDGAGPQCGVRTPKDCPAVTRGHAVTFPSSGDLAACPHLTNRPSGACSAMCVPVSISSRSVGVLHAVGPDHEPPAGEEAAMLVSLVARLGDHLTRVRATSETEAQASVDALTGLANRRSFENEFRRVAARGQPFALAYGDVDRFKALNDEHGHETGDRALRILSRTMRQSVRDLDVLARWGGEEFVLLLPGLTSQQAVEVLERVRTNLTIEQAAGAIPPFTISFGVCDDTYGVELDELLRQADYALMVAKQTGRNRVVVSDSSDTTSAREDVPA